MLTLPNVSQKEMHCWRNSPLTCFLKKLKMALGKLFKAITDKGYGVGQLLELLLLPLWSYCYLCFSQRTINTKELAGWVTARLYMLY